MTDDNTEEDVSIVHRVPWRRLANVVGLLLVLAVVVPFIVYAVPQVVGAEHSYVVLSGSMEPAMSPGDAVIVNDVSATEVEKGDVITFAQGGAERPTTHRVIEVVEQDGETAFKTQGDAVDVTDRALVTPADIEGKVMSVGGYLFVIPLIGYVIQFASTTQGLVALLIVPLALLVISEIWGVIAAAGGGGSAAAGEDDDDGDDGGGDDATAVTADAEVDAGDDGKPILDSEIDGEAVAFEELVGRVEERPGAGAPGAAATGDAAASEAAASADQAGASGDEAADAPDGAEAPESEEDGGEAADTEPVESGTEEGEETGGLVFSAAELQLGLLVLFGFFAYSAWVAYATFFQVWAFGVAASTGAALLLLAGLYTVGGEADTAEPAEAAEQQEQTVAEESATPPTDDSKSLFAATEDDTPAKTEPVTAAAADTGTDDTHSRPEVDIDELLLLGEAGEGDRQHAGVDLNGADKGLNGDGQGADAAEPAEVSNDD